MFFFGNLDIYMQKNKERYFQDNINAYISQQKRFLKKLNFFTIILK